MAESMNSHSPGHPDAHRAIEQKPLENPFDVFIGWGLEGLISQIESLVEQISAFVVVHESIFPAGHARRNS